MAVPRGCGRHGFRVSVEGTEQKSLQATFSGFPCGDSWGFGERGMPRRPPEHVLQLGGRLTVLGRGVFAELGSPVPTATP
jgi:hypothetical protein